MMLIIDIPSCRVGQKQGHFVLWLVTLVVLATSAPNLAQINVADLINTSKVIQSGPVFWLTL